MDVDLAVIGGGTAGLAAAMTGRQHGATVALVERDRLGGDCTWVGCVPSKTLIERAADVAAGRRAGLDGAPDDGDVFATIRETVSEIATDEDRPTLEKYGISVMQGDARFVGRGEDALTLDVGGDRLRARRVVIASGTRPAVPGIPGVRDGWGLTPGVLTNETVFDLDAVPRRLAVLGAGAVGLELTQAFARLGSQVTLIEADRVAAVEEPEVADALQQVFAREGIEVRTRCQLSSVQRAEGGLALTTDSGERVDVDALLVATGRDPNTETLGLDLVGVETDDAGHVRVDGSLATTSRGCSRQGTWRGCCPSPTSRTRRDASPRATPCSAPALPDGSSACGPGGRHAWTSPRCRGSPSPIRRSGGSA